MLRYLHLLAIAVLCQLAIGPATAQKVEKRELPYDAADKRIRKKPTAGDGRIIMGEVAPNGAYPFMVALIHGDAGNSEQDIYQGQFCGGSLIKQRWILTAAHCVYREGENGMRLIKPSEVNVYAGSNRFTGGQRIKVRNVIAHKDYDFATTDVDIALLELEAAPTAQRTGLVNLITLANETEIAAPGKNVIAAGWGEIETGDYPMDLRHVAMSVIDPKVCDSGIVRARLRSAEEDVAILKQKLNLKESVVQEIVSLLQKSVANVMTDSMMCSGRLGTRHDTCQGDSGGPLFVRSGNGFTQVGITSWGIGCGLGQAEGLYGVYTRVAKFADWVEQNTK